MAVRKGYLEGLNRDGIAETPEVAMASGGSVMSGFVGPVGWRETASAALCGMPGMCTMQNL